jgi:uncharacterized membrane protein
MTVHAAVTVNRPRDQVEDLWRSAGQEQRYGDDADVSFKRAPGDHGTEVHVVLDRSAPAGVVGEAVQKLLGNEPHAKLKDHLRHFKAIAETGEVPRSDGTPEGDAVERQLRQRPAHPLEEASAR